MTRRNAVLRVSWPRDIVELYVKPSKSNLQYSVFSHCPLTLRRADAKTWGPPLQEPLGKRYLSLPLARETESLGDTPIYPSLGERQMRIYHLTCEFPWSALL